jgi:hypothetical protein
MPTKPAVQRHADKTQYRFESLEHPLIQACFDAGGTAHLRRLADDLSCDAQALSSLAEAIDAGQSYHIGPEQIFTWWGWG